MVENNLDAGRSGTVHSRGGPASRRAILCPVDESPLHDRLQAAARGYSFRELGELTATHPETVRRYMQGTSPSYEFLSALCMHLGISGQWLLTGNGPMKAAEVRAASLREANPTELLAAMAGTLERLGDRVERLERFVHSLETRLRAGMSQQSTNLKEIPRGGSGASQTEAGTNTPGTGHTPVRASRIADAVTQRSRQDDR